MTKKRLEARAFGLRAETQAALWLQLKSYQILARNFSARGGEIDLIARRGDVIAFVEVKARPTLDQAFIAIDTAKASRISRVAGFWLSANPWAIGHNLRGDAIFIAPGRLPRHVEAAVPLELFV
jgi:putative endonuclease